MKLSTNGLAELKKHEGCRLTAYLCPAKVATIGYGCTGEGVRMGMTISQAVAEMLLTERIVEFENAVKKGVTASLNQHQFDALVLFAYNVGPKAFRDSTLLRFVNRNPAALDIGTEFMRWVYVNKVETRGLVNRRTAERNLYYKRP